jgi:hypothetical protein
MTMLLDYASKIIYVKALNYLLSILPLLVLKQLEIANTLAGMLIQLGLLKLISIYYTCSVYLILILVTETASLRIYRCHL